MARTQKFGIRFPFNIKSDEKTFVDLDTTAGEGIKSQIMHLIFTPVGQRIRRPLFGSKLIQFIFNPNDNQTYGDVVSEIKDMVKRNIPNCSLDDINVYEINDGLGLVASIKYSVSENGGTTQYQIMTNL
jgi:phage baseplate assembly protein W